MRITAYFSNENIPLTSPGDTPEIQIRDMVTPALEQAWTAMTEVGDGVFVYEFTEDPDLEYSFVCDGDPNATGTQTTAQERYVTGSFSGVNMDRFNDHARGTIKIDTTTDPWREVHYDVATGLVETDAFDLYDGDGNAINNTNPLTSYIQERRRT